MNKATSQPITSVYAKRWHLVLGATAFTLLAIGSFVFGVLLFLGIVKTDNGHHIEAGRGFCWVGGFFVLVASLIWFHVMARRGPLLRICHEGLELKLAGATSLDEIPLIPVLIRVLWSIVSLQGFSRQVVWVPWEFLQAIYVAGPPDNREIVIQGALIMPRFRGDDLSAKVADTCALSASELNAPLDAILNALAYFLEDSEGRDRLPSWYE